MATAASSADPSTQQAKQIANPRRLLILSPPSQSTSIIPPFLHSLTGVPVQNLPQDSTQSTPQDTDENPDNHTSFAGYTTHSPLHLETKYYSAEIPVWVDEVSLPDQSAEPASQWRTEFLSDEAQIVRDAVGALLVCVRNPGGKNTEPESSDVNALREFMRDIGDVKAQIDEERGGLGDVPGVFVLVGAKRVSTTKPSTSASDEMDLGPDEIDGDGEDELYSAGWWEDQLFDVGLVGWEVVEWDPKLDGGEKTRNKFGEYEGMPRIREVLETHDWTASGDLDDLAQDPDFGFDDEALESELLGFDRSSHTPGFGHEVQELEREMLGLRMAIERGGDDGEGDAEDEEEIKVESMEALMMRVQAIRDMGADLPENERKKFAAKAVNDLMRDL